MKKTPRFPALALSLLFLSGCGSKETGRLTGNIYFEKQAVSVGSITVVSADGKDMAIGRINPDGSYIVDKAPAGPVKIAFLYQPSSFNPISQMPIGKMPSDMKSKMQDIAKDHVPGGAPANEEMTEDQKKAAKALEALPERFRNWRKSGLETVVNANQDNSYNIYLKAK